MQVYLTRNKILKLNETDLDFTHKSLYILIQLNKTARRLNYHYYYCYRGCKPAQFYTGAKPG